MSELRKPEDARASFEIAMRLEEKDPDFPYNIGYTYYNERNYEKALEYFLKSVALGENTVTVLSKIGNCNDILGNHTKAISYHTRCIALDAADYGAYYNRGLAFLSMEAYDGAKKDFEKALSLDDEDVDVYYNLAKAYFGLGKLEKSLETIGNAMEMDTRNAGTMTYARRFLNYRANSIGLLKITRFRSAYILMTAKSTFLWENCLIRPKIRPEPRAISKMPLTGAARMRRISWEISRIRRFCSSPSGL